MRKRTFHSILALGLLDLFFLLQILVACPDLHHELHGDCDAAENSCAVKLIAQGQLEAPAPQVTPAPTFVLIPCARPATRLVLPHGDTPLPFTRGPPATA